MAAELALKTLDKEFVLRLIVSWMREGTEAAGQRSDAGASFCGMVRYAETICDETQTLPIVALYVDRLNSDRVKWESYISKWHMRSIFMLSRTFLHYADWQTHLHHCDVSRFNVTIKHHLKVCQRNIRKDFTMIKDRKGLREACDSFRHAIALEKYTRKLLKKDRAARDMVIWHIYYHCGRKDLILGKI